MLSIPDKLAECLDDVANFVSSWTRTARAA
jgi:hypothetical protein